MPQDPAALPVVPTKRTVVYGDGVGVIFELRRLGPDVMRKSGSYRLTNGDGQSRDVGPTLVVTDGRYPGEL